MLVSIHIPKTAGTTFGALLKNEFGPRLLLDYGDLVGYTDPEAIALRAHRKAEVWSKRGDILANFDCIHGHFSADKYRGFAPEVSFIAFFRHPYQQALSNYYFLLRNPQIEHPAVKLFHEQQMTIQTFLSSKHSGNIQTDLLGNLPLDELAVIGITEQFGRSVALFNAIYARKLEAELRSNTNPGRAAEEYPVDPEIMELVKRFREQDIDLYQHALERFESQCARLL